MSKINISIPDMETAVENFVYAAKGAGEINYRLKQLGNELINDIDLNSSPEYENVMSAFYQASNYVTKFYELIETIFPYVLKTPEMYASTEKASIDKINNMLKNVNVYSEGIVDDSVLCHLIEKTETEENLTGEKLAELIQNEYQSIRLSKLAANEIDPDRSNDSNIDFGTVANSVVSSSNDVNVSNISAMSDERKNGEV